MESVDAEIQRAILDMILSYSTAVFRVVLRWEYLSSGCRTEGYLGEVSEVQSRVWLQLMCCALLINQFPNFGARSKVGARLRKSEIGKLCRLSD